MKNSCLILTLVLMINLDSFAYDSTLAKYMPLQVGNVWVYYDHYAPPYPYLPSTSIVKYKIIGILDTLGKQYFDFQRTVVTIQSGYVCGVQYYSKLRLDSSSMNLYQGFGWCNSTEAFVDSLRSGLSNISYSCPPYGTNTCSDTNDYHIFGLTFKAKRFHSNYNPVRQYAMGLGIVKFGWAEAMNSCVDTLMGCVINGVLYGDTSMLVGVNHLSSEIPSDISLSQNYPNPFNPKTVIKFQVASEKFIKLMVYDALGKEITTLVNQELSPGTYQADWDGTNYPSGVYFYQLSANDELMATKRMVLIK